MPYIAQPNREKLDPVIDELAERIAAGAKEEGYDGAFAGLLNYACTRLALAVLQKRFGAVRYWLLATITGVFKNVADEFYRRLASPYEDKQIAKHGDVDLYEVFPKDMEKK